MKWLWNKLNKNKEWSGNYHHRSKQVTLDNLTSLRTLVATSIIFVLKPSTNELCSRTILDSCANHSHPSDNNAVHFLHDVLQSVSTSVLNPTVQNKFPSLPMLQNTFSLLEKRMVLTNNIKVVYFYAFDNKSIMMETTAMK